VKPPSLKMIDPTCVKTGVFLLCSSSGDWATASAFLSVGEADEGAARTGATSLVKNPDAVTPGTWRRELDALNNHHLRVRQPQQYR